MSAAAILKRPAACSRRERSEFARLVCRGFEGSDGGLAGRIAAARCLAFHRAADGTLTGIAALKAPAEEYRREVFRRADAGVDPAEYRLELGWVFVVSAHRGKRIGENLCRRLLADVPAPSVFATTRPNNRPMIRILDAVGFGRVGRPYPHVRRMETLVLFLRARPTTGSRADG